MSDVKTTDDKSFAFTDAETVKMIEAVTDHLLSPNPLDSEAVQALVKKIEDILKPSFDQTLE